jgi:PAS domain S-box-containing protein
MAKRIPPKRATEEATSPSKGPAARRRKGIAETVLQGEDHFRLLVESIKDYAIVMLDSGGHVVTWNAGAERIKGYRAEEIIGKHFSAFYPREDVERGKTEMELRVAASEGRFEDEGWRVRKDGSRFWANVIITALRDKDGKLIGFGKVTRDLTERRQAEEEKARVAETVREEMLRDLREAVTQLSTASAQILASTSQQAAGAQEQASAVSQTVTTVDQVAQTATQAAQRAKGVGEAVQRTVEIGQTGRQAVEDAIAALGQLKVQIEFTAESILRLAEQAQSISEIIATVKDIADQTNLLALNAAIESSRAGEYGRSFAVVASEIKLLADQSKKATVQVRQILVEIQKSTNTAVLSTEQVTKGVTATTTVAGKAGETIKTLAETLDVAAQSAAQIVASAGQQATGMSQISTAMKNLNQVAQQNLMATRQIEQAARNLNALGTKLASYTGTK